MSDSGSSPRRDDLDYDVTLRGLRAGIKVFGRYGLDRQLGRGGMGVVWLARDEKLGRSVALKFLPEEFRSDPVALHDLRKETNRCLDLTHSGIVRIHDLVEDDSTAAICMEFVDGVTFSALRISKPAGVLEPGELLPLLEQAAEALAYAHGKARILHRDLKPSNLMLTADGEVKVADFGIASHMQESASRLSRTGAIATGGTLPYMSPQQLVCERPSVTDDIYSFGATIYELLTSKPPFYGGGIEHQIQHVIPPSMTQRRSDLEVAEISPIPETWERTVAMCLDKDPARRPQRIQDVIGLLRGDLAPDIPAETPTTETAATSRKVRKRKGNGAALAAVAALVAATAVSVWWFGVEAPQRQRQEMARIAQEKAEAEAARIAQEKADAEAERLRLAKERADEEDRQRVAAVEQGRAAESRVWALQAKVGESQRAAVDWQKLDRDTATRENTTLAQMESDLTEKSLDPWLGIPEEIKEMQGEWRPNGASFWGGTVSNSGSMSISIDPRARTVRIQADYHGTEQHGETYGVRSFSFSKTISVEELIKLRADQLIGRNQIAYLDWTIKRVNNGITTDLHCEAGILFCMKTSDTNEFAMIVSPIIPAENETLDQHVSSVLDRLSSPWPDIRSMTKQLCLTMHVIFLKQ